MASTSVALLLVLAGLALNFAAGQLCRNNLTTFVFETFDCFGDRHLKCTGDCTCTAEGQVNLTSYDMKSWGRLMYSPGIRLMDPVSNRVASFSTNFTFSMRGEYSRPGEGMAFVMQGNPEFQGHSGGFLGLYNKDGKAGTPTIAIEFDTYRDWFYGFFRYNDINNNHVGLDIESINSKLQVDAGVFGIDLARERTVTAWIDYMPATENFDGNLQVRISADTTRPLLALISYDVDLSKHISEIMYMGFSATTGDWCLSYHSILNWSFESWGLVPPSPPPAPPATNPIPAPSVLPPIPLPPEPPSPSPEEPPPPPSPAPPAPPSPLPPPPESPTTPPPVPSSSPPAPYPEIPPSPAPSPSPLPNSTVPVPPPPSPSVSPPPAVPPSLPPHAAEPSLPPESTPTASAGPSPSSYVSPPAPASIPTPSAAPSPSSYIPPPASLPPVPTPSAAPSPASHVYPPAPLTPAPASSPTPSGGPSPSSYSPSPSPDFPSLPPAPDSHSAPFPSPRESPLEPPSSASPPATFPPSELPPMYPPAGPPSSPPSVAPGLSPSLAPSPESNIPPSSEPPSPTSIPAPAPTPEQGRADATRSMMVSIAVFALLLAGYVIMIWKKVQREVRDAHHGHGEDGYLLDQSVGGLWPFSR